MNRASEALLDRVVLAEELEAFEVGVHACVDHYAELAERAIWAILAPFGWTTAQLRNDGRQPSLLAFTTPYGAAQEPQPTRPPLED
jgi:hypothetical protein